MLVRPLHTRSLETAALVGLVALTTGCRIPANSPLTGLAQLRPVHEPHTNVLPPAAMLQHPGPGVDGPGPGVIMPASYEAALGAAGAGGMGIDGMGMGMMGPASQISFLEPAGMQVRWDVAMPGGFDSDPLIAPGRYDFTQGAIYRLKLTDIPGYEGTELYPTIEVGPETARTAAYLAHNAVPFVLTDEDFTQVLRGNFVTKVVYLPDAEYQELAVAGVETLVSTRLDPGVDPVVEADRRGSILAIIRIGNKDLQTSSGGTLAGGAGMAGGGGGDGAMQAGAMMPLGMPCGGDPSMLPPAFVAGATAPQYGMPVTGTPIGLPGPAHIPLGIPAGLQRHTITNHTKMHIPPPTRSLQLHVQQQPGLSYPKPARRAYITERADVPRLILKQPHGDQLRMVDTARPSAARSATSEAPRASDRARPAAAGERAARSGQAAGDSRARPDRLTGTCPGGGRDDRGAKNRHGSAYTGSDWRHAAFAARSPAGPPSRRRGRGAPGSDGGGGDRCRLVTAAACARATGTAGGCCLPSEADQDSGLRRSGAVSFGKGARSARRSTLGSLAVSG
jgi:hypothetical protein